MQPEIRHRVLLVMGAKGKGRKYITGEEEESIWPV